MLKKFLSLILSVMVVSLSLPHVAWADVVDSGTCGEKVNWSLDSDGKLTISGEGAMKFWGPSAPWSGSNEKITSVEIRNGVTSIGGFAFENCTNLTSITIPDSVTKIGACAFDSCSGLTSITIPDGVTSIESYAFSGCSGLTSITIPDGVTSIGNEAFEACSGLESVTIPDSVTKIGACAFDGCSGLESIDIPSSVTKFEYGAFVGTPWLAAKQQKNPLVIINNLLIDGTTASGYVTIPDGVTSIQGGAFNQNNNLTKITIPNSVTSIEDWAFAYCSSLTSITIPCDFKDEIFSTPGSGIVKDGDTYTITYWDSETRTNKTTTGTFEYVHNLSYEDNGKGKHIGTCQNEECCKKTMDGNYTTEAKYHSLGDLINEVPASCTTDGTKAHYTCSVCEKHFENQDGTSEITDLNIKALGHDYKEEVIQPTKANIGGTKHRCKNCGDEYWDNFTKDDTYAQTVMPNGETIYHYCTHNGLAAETTVDIGDGQTIKVFLQDPLGVLKQKDNDVLGIDVQYVKDGSDRYKELMSKVDRKHPIEHIKFFDVYPTVNGKPKTGKLDKSVYMEYEIPDGWDEEDLEMILVQDGDDQDFDEIVLNIDGKKYLAMWKNHFSPYAMIDKLSEKEQAELDKQKNEQNLQSLSQMRTGDETGYMIFVSALICAAATLVIFKKKRVD